MYTLEVLKELGKDIIDEVKKNESDMGTRKVYKVRKQ
jgi:hypothetical protein